MNWQATIAAGTMVLFCTLCVNADNGNTQVTEEAGQSTTSDSTSYLPNVADLEAVRKAAEQGSAPAQFNLAILYYSGEGVQQNFRRSAKWFRKAAEQGHVGAQKNLAVMYGIGRGVTLSHANAYIWASVAAKYGDNDSLYIRKFAAKHLSSKNLDSADKRVAKLYEEIQLRKAGE